MRKQKIMFIGSYSQDIFYLLEIAGELRSLGHECYFLVTNPIVAARNKALEEVREKGYEAEEMLESKFTERGMLSQMFSVNKARVEFSKALFKRLKPDLIITTKIVFYGKFFEVANSMNIPSVYYQWTFIHSRENVNRIKNKEYSYSVAKNGLFTMYKAKLRRKFKDFFTLSPVPRR